MAVTSLIAVTATASVASAVNTRRAAKAQQRAARINERRLQVERSRARRQAIREARSARGRTLNVGANQGVSGSSGIQGALGSIQSQGAANISFLDQTGRLADQASAQLGRARKFQSRASTFSDIASISMAASGIPGINNIFGTPGATPAANSTSSVNSIFGNDNAGRQL